MKRSIIIFCAVSVIIYANFRVYSPTGLAKKFSTMFDRDMITLQEFKNSINDKEDVWTGFGDQYATMQNIYRNPKDMEVSEDVSAPLKGRFIQKVASHPDFVSYIGSKLETPNNLLGVLRDYGKMAVIVSTLSFIPLLYIFLNSSLMGGIIISILYSLAFALIILNSQGLLSPHATLIAILKAVRLGEIPLSEIYAALQAILVKDGIFKIVFLLVSGPLVGLVMERKKGVLQKEFERLNLEFKTLQATYSRSANAEKQLKKDVEKIQIFSSRTIALQSLSKVLGNMLEPEAIYREVIDKTQNVFKAKRCSLWLLDDRKQTLRIKEAFGWKREEAIGLEIPLGEEILGYVAQNGESVSLIEIKKDFRLSELAKNAKVPSILCAALKLGNKVNGVINIEDMDQEKSTGEDMRMFDLLAILSGLALNNAGLHAKTVELANTDGLTKLYNNRFFQQFFEREIEKCKKSNTNVSIFMTDIDHFKRFNDTYGHQVGDFVLEETAKVLKTSIRSQDLAARYGGEEFVAVLPGIDLNSAMQAAEVLRKNVEIKKYSYKGENLGVTISIGVATFPLHGTRTQELIRHADSGLYVAKEGGRNRVCCAQTKSD
ncbi:MAG: GGDEF domain-containing protein [Candidatus Wallbacteria bacterium]|nr:GGDEF domain-containing protein [Candidatus Wallbacteria bacterium]